MIKLKDLLTEQSMKDTMLNWLTTNKKAFMDNLKRMGFNPRGFAINQLGRNAKDKTLGGVSILQNVTNNQAFNTVSGAPTKIMTGKNALASSVTQSPVVITAQGKIKLNLPSGIKKGRNFPVDPMAGQMNVVQLCLNANTENIANYRVGGNQITNIFASQDGKYNEATVARSSNLHLFSTKEVATKTVPGKKATPDKTEIIPGAVFQPISIPGGNFNSNSAQLSNPGRITRLITQRIQDMRQAGVAFPAGIGQITIISGTDSMPSNYGGRGNQGLAQDRAATIQQILIAQGIPQDQITINTSGVNAVPPGTTSWANKSSSQTRQQWIDAAQPARTVQVTFAGAQAPDGKKTTKGTPGTPSKEVDAPKKVTINHLEEFFKK